MYSLLDKFTSDFALSNIPVPNGGLQLNSLNFSSLLPMIFYPSLRGRYAKVSS